jgi:hypothetical protein
MSQLSITWVNGLKSWELFLKEATRCWWLTPVILATWKAEIGSSWFEDSLGK